ncbi:MAG: NTP transferase domain-containing protein [Candidatus Cloacimonetes bacterium]|nr:NTP transferase domain-containing protein [Candidatus Cloacimonadota bacterium]
MKKLAAIILAAGKGTRMKSDKPKVVFNFAEKPMIQRVVDTALETNCDKIATVVGFKKEIVIDSLQPNLKNIFIEQKKQNGTGHAVIVTEEVFKDFDGDIFILCGDVPLLTSKTLKKILTKHQNKKAACTVLTAVMDDALKYGRIVRNIAGNVERIVEFKDATAEQKEIKEINSGIYCFDAKSLFTALKSVNSDNMQGEYYLTDTLEILNDQGKLVTSVLLDEIEEASGVNSQEQLADLENLLYSKIRKHWLNNGVVIENPQSVIIGSDVNIEQNVEIAANTIIKGNTIIKSGSRIGVNCYLLDSTIECNTKLQGFNVIVNSTLKENSIINFYDKRVN